MFNKQFLTINYKDFSTLTISSFCIIKAKAAFSPAIKMSVVTLNNGQKIPIVGLGTWKVSENLITDGALTISKMPQAYFVIFLISINCYVSLIF